MASRINPIDQTRLHRFIATMPKAELHLHIEGTLEPEMMMRLAQRNNVVLPYASVEADPDAYRFASLQDFLDLYYTGMSVLRTREDFFDLAFAYLEKVAAQNVTHAEIFFDPQGHTDRGISFDTVLSGLTDALDKGRRDFGITSRLIMCFLRHLPEEQAFDTLRQACRCKEHIFAVGLDSTENGHPPSKFARVFAEARQEGFVPVAHAGEEGPPAYVCEAIDILRCAAHRSRQSRVGGSGPDGSNRKRANTAYRLPVVQPGAANMSGPDAASIEADAGTGLAGDGQLRRSIIFWRIREREFRGHPTGARPDRE